MTPWTVDQMEALRSKGLCESRYLQRIEAAALLFLNERDDLLCEMSRNDGEWPNRTGIARKRVKRMKVLRGILEDQADGLVAYEDTTELIWGVLDRICEEYGFDPTVWGLKWERENP